MTSFRSDPYLWLHLAGLAAVPLWLFVAWLGIAAGYPIAPTLLEIILLVSVGIVPILVMQWKRPFSPFGLLLFSLQPSQLSLAQRKMLQRLQSNRTHFLTGLGVIPMIWIIGQLYTLAPLAQGATPIPNHVVGLGVAAIALLAANLFWQVPLSVVGVLLTRPSQFDATEPYPVAAISAAFTSPGFPVQKILPVASSAQIAAPPTPGSTAPEPEASETDAIAIPTPDDPPDPSETPLASVETAVEASAFVEPAAAVAEPAEDESTTDEMTE
ncbi:low-complexity tail membrane protein [Spirulina subsalsa CS-330]|nr:low-complexity tail membrane protein [Spirulina subsalsa CS-330]